MWPVREISPKPSASLSKISSPDTCLHDNKSREGDIFWETNQILAVGKLRNPRKPLDIFREPAGVWHQVPWVMQKLLHLMDSSCFTSYLLQLVKGGTRMTIWPDLIYHSLGERIRATAKDCHPEKGRISHNIIELLSLEKPCTFPQHCQGHD